MYCKTNLLTHVLYRSVKMWILGREAGELIIFFQLICLSFNTKRPFLERKASILPFNSNSLFSSSTISITEVGQYSLQIVSGLAQFPAVCECSYRSSIYYFSTMNILDMPGLSFPQFYLPSTIGEIYILVPVDVSQIVSFFSFPPRSVILSPCSSTLVFLHY